MEAKVSVVVPVYNVEAYLSKCVESIIHQTFREIEIILVDDGSKDNSLALANELAQKDDRIVVYHKENGGLSSARNYGIDRASADLITFVDSDDYLDLDMIEVLYRGLTENNTDMSVCTFYDVYPGSTPEQNKNAEQFVAGKEDAMKIVLEAKLASVVAVAKLYKKELFDKVRYPEGKIAEDAFVIIELLDQCDRIFITTQRKYYYFHRENSITTSTFNARNTDVITAYEKNYDFISRKYPDLTDTAKMRVCWAYFYVLDKLAMSSNKEKDLEDKVVSFLRKNCRFVLNDSCFTKGRKIAMCALMISRRLYKTMARAFIDRKGVFS